ncbi:MAG: 2-C-methyl-D-erythritol 4-phosphate cytidylyltransferase [Acidimicrobiales bacterium]
MGQVWGIVVAAGSGRRFGGPKQFQLLHGRRIVDWSVATASAACDRVVVVLPRDRLEPGTVAGGATRSDSVRAGLAAVPDDADIVVVHDAARPLASADLFARVIEAVRSGADAAIPGVPVTDTIKAVAGSVVVSTVERSTLVAVQTPQAFRAASLRRAHASAPEASDDAALIEADGGVVVVVAGEARNLKITSPDDLAVAGMWLTPTP